MARAPRKAAGKTEKADGRRGRPSISRATSIDATIRAAALELFLEQGFDAVTMEMIAQTAQVSKPTVYTRHAGKVELLRAVVQDEVKRWLSLAHDQDRTLPTDLAERLRVHARNIIASQGWSDFRRLNRLITGVAATHPEILKSPYEVGLRPVVEYLASDLRHAAKTAGYESADWEFLAEAFFHAVFGWYNASSMLGEVQDEAARAFSEKMAALVLMAAENEKRKAAAGERGGPD